MAKPLRRDGAMRLIVAAVCIAWCAIGQAQRLFAVTEPMSVDRRSTGTYLQAVDFGGDTSVTDFHISDESLEVPPVVHPDAARFTLLTAPEHPGGELTPEDTLSACEELAPGPQTTTKTTVLSPLAMREQDICVVTNSENVTFLASTATSVAPAEPSQAYILLRRWTAETGLEARSYATPLPGEPLALTAQGASLFVAVVTQEQDLRIIQYTPMADSDLAPYRLWTIRTNDVAPEYASVTSAGNRLWITGYGGPGEPSVRLWSVDTSRTGSESSVLPLPGAIAARVSIIDNDGNCWVSTYDPINHYGHVTCVSADTDGALRVKAQHPLGACDAPPTLAMAPFSRILAVAVDRRLEVWRDFTPTNPVLETDQAIDSVLWTPEGLFVAEAGRIHRVDPASGAIFQTIQLQTGFATHLSPWPKQLVRERMAALKAPVAPPCVVLQAEKAGQSLSAIPIFQDSDVPWRLEMPHLTRQWLRAAPIRGQGRDILYVGIDPSRYGTANTIREGYLEFHYDDTVQTTRLRVMPAHSTLRRILWLWPGVDGPPLRGTDNPHEYRQLAEHLAGMPHQFTHRDVYGLPADRLSLFSVLVLDMETVSYGAVTRQALLNYVHGGGGLLFIATGDVGETARPWSENWLSPLGVHVDSRQLVAGQFAATTNEGLGAFWPPTFISQGCMVRVDDVATVVVPGPDTRTAILATLRYGQGRIAVLASPEPLRSATLNLPFALALFEWLAGTGLQAGDLDGDGLLDTIEDANGDGIVAPYETNPRDPDTDHDGVPDGIEDRNHNGILDPGETDPRSNDTDQDGIHDGADATPVLPL